MSKRTSVLNMENKQRIAQLIRKKDVYSSSLERRIIRLENLVKEGQSSAKIRYLRGALLETYVELKGFITELENLGVVGCDFWLEKERHKVDKCLYLVDSYLQWSLGIELSRI